MTLLQELLLDRSECLLLLKRQVWCSCGTSFSGFTEAENHLVQHPKVSSRLAQIDPARVREPLTTLRTLLQEATEAKFSTLVVPEKCCYVLLEEEEIGGGTMSATVCSECGHEVSGFEDLKDHFLSHHALKWQPESESNCQIISSKANYLAEQKKKRVDWTYSFFCPLPGCKYHVLEENPKPMSNLKSLRQHWTKVHSQKMFSCSLCDSSFASAAILSRHEVICGNKFTCGDCGSQYESFENLQTHGRRKEHLVESLSQKRKKETAALKQEQEVRVQTVFNYTADGLIKIAPKPSSMHLNAAIALSELSGNNKHLFSANVPKTDMAVQTTEMKKERAELVSVVMSTQTTQAGRKRSAETQTRRHKPKAKKQMISSSTSMIIPDEQEETPMMDTAMIVQVSMAAASIETQTPKLLSSVFDDFDVDSGSLVAKDRPLWAAGSTQTSPTRTALEDSFNKERSVGVGGDDNGADSRSRPPKLGEIEQYSTETQTDLGLATSAHVSGEWDSLEPSAFASSLRLIEAETQFDLDDILCSNYTQTMTIDRSLQELLPVDVAATVSSIETQTGMQQLDELGSQHMETQTGTMEENWL